MVFKSAQMYLWPETKSIIKKSSIQDQFSWNLVSNNNLPSKHILTSYEVPTCLQGIFTVYANMKSRWDIETTKLYQFWHKSIHESIQLTNHHLGSKWIHTFKKEEASPGFIFILDFHHLQNTAHNSFKISFSLFFSLPHAIPFFHSWHHGFGWNERVD